MSKYDTLNPQQKEAVFQCEGPMLILAGAGSGKTRVLTHRIAYMIETQGIKPWNILAITFTNKAAEEMRTRVDDLVGYGADQIWVSTFHSACVRILRRYINLIGYETTFTIYDGDDQKSVIKDVCKRLEIDTKSLKERTILGAISSAKDELISPEEFTRNAGSDFKMSKIAEAYVEYQKTLRKNNALDFDDLICKTVELFQRRPDVLEQYQERFRYIMVDEYQDTNTAQFELIHLLAGKYRNLCVVGDDDQSIYKFRGANIHNILDFEKYFKEAIVIKLEQNYRSTQNILDAANAVIRHNEERKEKALWTSKGAGEKLHFRQFDSAYEEAQFIAYDIKKKDRMGDATYGQCAVLYRTNAQSRLIEEQFVQENIPYNLVGGVNFYSRKEIKDILAYLKTLDNGRDDLAVKRIINVPKRGIGATTIAKVDNYALFEEISFYDALTAVDRIPGLGKSGAKLTAFVSEMENLKARAQVYSLRELFQQLLDITKYFEYLEETDEENAEDRIENIEELRNKLIAYEESAEEPSLSGFLEEVALVADIDSVEDGAEKVLLMTLHGAKGLEFEQVYLAGLEDGIFPSYMTMMDEDPTAIEEERRLAYVGITRAKENLTITCARMRMLHGETQYNPVSRFVREIPEALIEGDEVPSQRRREPASYSNYGTYRESGSYREPNTYAPKTYGSSQPSLFLDDSMGNVRPAGGFSKPAPTSFVKPKVTLKPKVTAAENKPFIAKGVGGLTKGSAFAAGSVDYVEGDRVSHIKFGTGTVRAIVKEPKDYKVTVDFDEAGTKIMYAAFAKLKKI